MSINAALTLFLEGYEQAHAEYFSGNAVADFVRSDFPEIIRKFIGPSDRYLIHGSAGQGAWAKVPWVAIFDRLVTETAQDGFYIVYLFKEDLSGVYISLNQGVTTIRKTYGSDAKSALAARSADYVARIGKVPPSLHAGPIDLCVTDSSGLGSLYEAGAILSKLYLKGQIPVDNVLEDDLRQFLDLYLLLSTKEITSSSTASKEDDELGLQEEDLTTLREHKRIERNRKLAEQAKKALGYVCKACGFDFSVQYGEIGKHYIEAHHLTPLHTLKGQTVSLDPKKDFTVLCANCHRMIHRSEFVDKVEEFRGRYVVNHEK